MARTLHAGEMARHRPLPVADLDHGLGTAAVALGTVGLLLVAVNLPTSGGILGIVGLVMGLWAQMISRNRVERFVDITGLLLSFLAVATCMSQGGF